MIDICGDISTPMLMNNSMGKLNIRCMFRVPGLPTTNGANNIVSYFITKIDFTFTENGEGPF